LIQISALDHAVVAVKVARGDGEVDCWPACAIALKLGRILCSTISHFRLYWDVVLFRDILKEVA